MTTKRAVEVVGKAGGIQKYRKVRVKDPASVDVVCRKWDGVWDQSFVVKIDGEDFTCDQRGPFSATTGFVVLRRDGESLLCDDLVVIASINKYVWSYMLHGMEGRGYKVFESKHLEILPRSASRRLLKLLEIPHPGKGWWY